MRGEGRHVNIPASAAAAAIASASFVRVFGIVGTARNGIRSLRRCSPRLALGHTSRGIPRSGRNAAAAPEGEEGGGGDTQMEEGGNSHVCECGGGTHACERVRFVQSGEGSEVKGCLALARGEGKFLRLNRRPPPLTRPVCCRAVTSTTSLPPIWPGALYGQRAEGGMCTGKEQDVRTAALRGSADDVFLAGFKMPWKEIL